MIKLGALLINGVAINAAPYDPGDIPTGLDLYTFGASLPSEYTDISSILNWNAARRRLNRDYIWVNDRLQIYGDADTTTYDAYSDEEKTALAENNATSKARITAVLGQKTDVVISSFERKAVKCRRHRFSLASSVIKNNCDQPSQHAILGGLNSTKYRSSYINYGVTGINYGDTIDGIINWIESSEGEVGTGMMDLTLVFDTSMTKPQLRDKLIKILYDGDYNYIED